MSTALSSPDYNGHQLLAFVIAFTPIEVAAVALRFYARSLTASGYGPDDWLVLAALFGQLGAAAISIGGVRQGGIGYHVGYLEETNPQAIVTFFKYLVAVSSWYYATISLSKLAICLLYRRLFPQRWVFVVLCITAGILVLAPTASLIANLAACEPFSANWASSTVQAAQCIDKEPLFVWSTFPNIVTDLIMLGVPLPIVWKLHTSTRLKMALTFTFAVGSIGLVASIVRFATFANDNSFIDATYHAVELFIWTVAEPGIYLISACLLTYRPLLDKFKITTVIGSKSSSAGGDGNGRGYMHGQRPAAGNYILGTRTITGGTGNPGGGGIALRSLSNSGSFEQLPDDADDTSLCGRVTPPSGIKITTRINQSWHPNP